MTRAERILVSGGTPLERLEAIREVATPARIAVLRGLPYAAFLQTGYWRIITTAVRSERGHCERCGSKNQLQVHHRTYENHGFEHDHLKDLELLCRTCHTLEHNIPVSRHLNNSEWLAAGELIPAAMNQINYVHYLATEGAA